MKDLYEFITESKSNNVLDFLKQNGVNISEKHYHDYTFENISNIDGKEVWICKNTEEKIEPTKVTCYIPKTNKEKAQLKFCPFGLKTETGQIIIPMVQKYNGWKGNDLLFGRNKEECNRLVK